MLDLMQAHRFKVVRNISYHRAQLSGACLLLEAFHLLGSGLKGRHQLHYIIILALCLVEDT